MSATDQRLAKLTPAQRALLEQRLRQKTRAATSAATIPRRPDDGPALLSFSQRRQWFLQQLEPDNAAYHRYSVNRLRGSLDVAALRRAIDALVNRHSALRTTYAMGDTEPLQTVQPPTAIPLPVVDLSDLNSAEQESRLQELIREQLQRPFDLAAIPMWRHVLFWLAVDDHVLLRISHHIASDRWSVGIVNRELAHYYAAFSSGTAPDLPDLPIQYVDFAVWQRQQTDSSAENKQLSYWLRQLDGAPQLLELPTDFPRPSIPTMTGATQRATLSAETSRAIRSFSHAHEATPFMTILALFNVLLHRYTGATDLLIGVPIAGRTPVDTTPLVGIFINTLVMRTDLSGNPTFIDLLRQVRRTALDAFANQTLPFEKLVEELQPDRIPGHTPLFQVMFDYLNTPMQPLQLAGLEVEQQSMRDQAASHDLSLVIHDESERLALTIEYDTDLYRPQTISRLLDHLQILIDGILENANRPIGSLPLLTTAEKAQLMQWSGSTMPLPDIDGVHQMVEAQAVRTPHATALIAGDRSLSYAELDQRANQLAALLQSRGVGAGAVVALELPRSAEWIIAILGVLKSGAAYLPLDPEMPTARRDFQISDSGAQISLQQSGVDSQLSVCSLPPSDFRLPPSAAYVIYTSGSTGRPKGVTVPHRAVVNFVADAIERYDIGPTDRVLQFASPAFDTAVEEIFPTLAAGGTLVLRPIDLPDTFADFARQIERNAITVLDLPTAFWHSWVAEMQRDRHMFPACVRLVIVGGEAARLDTYRQWRERTGTDVRWVNTYGPTETTVVATAFEPSDTKSLHTMPIGRPLNNVRAYVLDHYGNPAPIGIPGELCIGGAGVALGYLNQPDLTQTRFISHPSPTTRSYRTGDRVRWLPDGNLEFIGRTDDQVKIRGVRVELGEVEAALRQHPDVAEAVVVSREMDDGGLQLAAYVVPSNAALASEAIRTHLTTLLPSAMQPATIALLQALPLTTSGKIDRKALIATDSADSAIPIESKATSSAEIVMTSLWAELLNLPVVGLHDNFFDLGGHSLLAVQLVSRITATLRIPLTLRALFNTPTPAGLLTALAPTAADQVRLEKTAAIVLHVARLSDAEAQAQLQTAGDKA
ncbi:MAG: amino acid adenylation domain-containing protein [Anaerolineae bacterium]|nr:amino acid adenylation domain-containing protein [Anaerolineae bacterium]